MNGKGLYKLNLTTPLRLGIGKMTLTKAVFGPSKNFEVSATLDVLDGGTDTGPLFVPGGDFLLGAAYERLGPDLILFDDARSVLVKDYFTFERPPDLYNSEGTAVIEGSLALRLSGPNAPGQFAQTGALKLGQSIGQVDTIEGRAFLTRLDGQNVLAEKGIKVFEGDIVETQKDANIGIKFVDETSFALGESGRMVIDTMIYDPGANTGNSSFNIVQGVFSFVSGQVAKFGEDAMTVKTPVATIGVRGTTVVGKAAAEGSSNTITLLPDSDGGIGQITVSNAAGIQLMSTPFQTTKVISAFAAPAVPTILPASQIKSLYGNISKALSPVGASSQQQNNDNNEEAEVASITPTEDEGESAPSDEEEASLDEEGEGLLDEEGEGLLDEEGEGLLDEEGKDSLSKDRESSLGEEGEGSLGREREGLLGEEGEGSFGEEGEDLLDEGEKPPGAPDTDKNIGGVEDLPPGEEEDNGRDRYANASDAFDNARKDGLSEKEAFAQAASAFGATDEEKQVAEQTYKQALSEGLSEREALFRAEDSIRDQFDTRREGLEAEVNIAAAGLKQATAGGSSIEDAIREQLSGSITQDDITIVQDAAYRNLDNAAHSGDTEVWKDVIGPVTTTDSVGKQAFALALLNGKSVGDAFGAAWKANLDAGARGADGQIDYLAARPDLQGFDPIRLASAKIRAASDELRIENDLAEGTISDFTEILFGTSGNDTLEGKVGSRENTSFVFEQGSTLGGTDTIDGFGGTDDFTLKNLSDILLKATFNDASDIFEYSNPSGSISGTITAKNLEQFNFKIVDGTNQPIVIPDDEGEFGVIVVGTSGNDTIDIGPDGTSAADVTFGSLSIDIDIDNFIGELIFGGDGDDTITTSGVEGGIPITAVVFGGAGNDTIISRKFGNIIQAGDGDDTIIIRTESDIFGNTGDDDADVISGGNNSSVGDTLQFGTASTSTGLTYNFATDGGREARFTGIENINFFQSNTVLQAFGESFILLTEITGESGVTGVTLRGAGRTLNLADVSVSSAVSTLTGTASLGEGVRIIDSTKDSIGRILIGTSDPDELNGSGGDDIIRFGGGSTRDVVLGGDGNDTFEILANTDITAGLDLSGGAGVDTLSVKSTGISTLVFPLENETAISQTGGATSSFTGLEVFDLSGGATGGVTVKINGRELEAITKITGDGTNDILEIIKFDYNLTNGSRRPSDSNLTGIETIKLTEANSQQTLSLSNDTTISGLTTIQGTVATNGSREDDISVFGNRDFSGITLTNIDDLSLGDGAGNRQTIGVNATTSLGLTEITNFQVGSNSTSDIFDYKSNLRSGKETTVSSDNLSLTSLTSAGSDTIISGSNSGVFAFQFSAARLDLDLSASTISQITSATNTVLGSQLTSSSNQVTQGAANTDILLLFNGSGTSVSDTVIIRYQEGSTSETSFAGELSVVAIFDSTTNSNNQLDGLFDNVNIV